MSEGKQVWIRARNYDGSPHWEHPATLVRADDAMVITQTSADLTIQREGGASVFISPYNTRAHYWPDRWFNAIRLELPGKGLDGFYCNIASPVEFDGETVRYTDLQLDVRVFAAPDGSLTHRLLDEDEFEAACLKYGYPEDLVARCLRAVAEVISMVEARQFPFDTSE